MTEVLRREIALRCAPAHAFAVFTDMVDLWWPPGHRRNRDSRLRFEARQDGRLLDIAPDGSEWTMARVTLIEPPRRLLMDWFPGSPKAPTTVEVCFEANSAGTTIRIVHRALTDEARAVWNERVERFATGWLAVLPALRSHIHTQPEENAR